MGNTSPLTLLLLLDLLSSGRNVYVLGASSVVNNLLANTRRPRR